MKEIRLCDDASLNRVYELCVNKGLGVEVQGFYNPNLIDTVESDKLLAEYKKALENFQGGKSLHAPFWDLNLGSKNPLVKEATMKAFNYSYKIAKELGCTEIVVHNGFVPNTSFYEGWVRNATSFWQEFFSDKDDSITMMIENQCEEDSEVWSYYFQCYNQKNHGSLNYRIKKGLDTTDACSTPIIAEWKLKLTANVIFDIIWNNKTKIIKIANDIIEQTIQNNSINLIVNDEIEEYENRITSNKNKLDRIVDMYVNELIDKESFMKKKADIEKNNNYLQEKIEKANEKKAIPKEELEDKLSILKKNIINNLEYDRSDEISEDLIESYVEKIVVGKDRYKWKLNYLKDIYDLNALKNISASEINNDSKDFYLTTIIITDDDVKNYRKRLRTCGLERAKKLKNNIIVDLYI